MSFHKLTGPQSASPYEADVPEVVACGPGSSQGTFHALGEASLGGSPILCLLDPTTSLKGTSLQAWVPGFWEEGGGLASAPVCPSTCPGCVCSCSSPPPCLPLLRFFRLTARLPHRLLTAPHPAHRAPGSVSAGACANHSRSCLHGLPSSLTFPTCAALNAIHLSLVVSFSLTLSFCLALCVCLKAQNNRQLYVHKKCTREVIRSWYKVPLTSISTQSIPSPEATTIYGFVSMHG